MRPGARRVKKRLTRDDASQSSRYHEADWTSSRRLTYLLTPKIVGRHRSKYGNIARHRSSFYVLVTITQRAASHCGDFAEHRPAGVWPGNKFSYGF